MQPWVMFVPEEVTECCGLTPILANELMHTAVVLCGSFYINLCQLCIELQKDTYK